MITLATYFDGHSSVPHTVEIEFDDRNNELVFLSSNFLGKSWKLDQLKIQQLDHCLELCHQSTQLELLKITDKAFASLIISGLKQKGKLSVYHQILFGGFKIHIAIAVGLLLLISISYFYVLPFAAEKAASYIPEDFDNYLSQQFVVDYFIENQIDTIRSKEMSDFAGYIDFKNTKELKFYVVESETVNAFALPDGTVVVFSGLLDKIKSPEELAALLSHEVVHVNNRHSVKMLARNLAGYLFISIIFSDVNGIMAIIAQNAQNLQSLSFSRKFENEADSDGLQILLHNHLNPNGMIHLFTRLKSEELAVPTFLSTHPVTDDRISNIKQQIAESKFKPHVNSELQNAWYVLRSK